MAFIDNESLTSMDPFHYNSGSLKGSLGNQKLEDGTILFIFKSV